MRIIDRCSTCKYLGPLFEAKGCWKLADGIGRKFGTFFIIKKPEEFGCIHWEERKKNETI